MSTPWDKLCIEGTLIGVAATGQFDRQIIFRVVAGRQDRMVYYWPHNPHDPEQQTWRVTFADGIAAWQALTPAEKAQWKLAARAMRKRGFDLFMSTWLLAHPLTGQPAIVGISSVQGGDYVAAAVPAQVESSYVGDSTVITW